MKYVRCDSHCKYPAYDKEEVDKLFEEFYGKIYPIGSIYISLNETNPNTLFGGEWEQIKDTFLLSAGDTYKAGSTGGEAEHTLDWSEMPMHNHNVVYSNNSGAIQLGEGGSQYKMEWTKTGFDEGNEIMTTTSGGSKPHNNMPPYLTVFMWKRVA